MATSPIIAHRNKMINISSNINFPTWVDSQIASITC